jgi:hypothetical protein
MSDSNSTLDDFGGGTTRDKPFVERKRIVWAPPEHTKPAGFLGRDKSRDVKTYTTRRTGYHFYYLGDGYAISDSIIRKLRELEIPYILIHEKGEGDVYEFRLRQYENGEAVPERDLDDLEDPQTYVEIDEHIAKWPAYQRELFQRTFEDAYRRSVTRYTDKEARGLL